MAAASRPLRAQHALQAVFPVKSFLRSRICAATRQQGACWVARFCFFCAAVPTAHTPGTQRRCPSENKHPHHCSSCATQNLEVWIFQVGARCEQPRKHRCDCSAACRYTTAPLIGSETTVNATNILLLKYLAYSLTPRHIAARPPRAELRAPPTSLEYRQ